MHLHIYFCNCFVTVEPVIRPLSIVQYVNTTATLSCEATARGDIRYQWRRVNGEISSDRANGVNTSTLTISSVTEQDEDEYYCIASNGGADGLLYNDISQKAMIIVSISSSALLSTSSTLTIF